jgi:site-specific DNA-methyltransferase (adenine-specific)
MNYKRKEIIGDATLICGCCEEAMAEMTANQFELAIVDPPYGLERFKKGGSHINKHGSEKKKWNNTKPSQEYFDILFAKSGNQIIWGANNFSLPTSEYFIVWQKGNAIDFSFAMVEQAWTNIKKPAKLFTYFHAQNKDARIHPTQKPVNLYKWLLKNYAKEGDHILDTHGGSMSSVIACLDMGFKITCYEIDEDYFDAGVERVREHVKQLRLF